LGTKSLFGAQLSPKWVQGKWCWLTGNGFFQALLICFVPHANQLMKHVGLVKIHGVHFCDFFLDRSNGISVLLSNVFGWESIWNAGLAHFVVTVRFLRAKKHPQIEQWLNWMLLMSQQTPKHSHVPSDCTSLESTAAAAAAATRTAVSAVFNAWMLTAAVSACSS
jgi:hypothetical protein